MNKQPNCEALIKQAIYNKLKLACQENIVVQIAFKKDAIIKTNGQTKEVSEFCQKIPNSSIIAYTMGYYDLIMELVAKDMKELKRIVEEIKNQESVLQVDVNIVLNWEKWEFPAEFI